MKKMFKIFTIAILCIVVLAYLPFIFSSILFPVPKEMKKESVCFLVPELSWSDSFADVEKHFGKPIEQGEYNDITGTKTNTYKTKYENRPMTVSAKRQAFPLGTKVFEYTFIVVCSDLEDSKNIFDIFYNEIIKSNSTNTNFQHELIDDNTATFSINYGATGIYYELDYDDEGVVLTVHCQY